MKKRTFIFALAALFALAAACNKKKEEQKAVDKKTVYKVAQLFDTASEKIDQEVVVTGYVTHTCKHSGRRCFIVGEDPNLSLRIEAKGITEGFKSELIGSKIIATGILKEKQLSKEYIDQMEEEIKEKHAEEDGSEENCQAEMQNIQKMRDWMKANNKDYYAVYYLDGNSYEVTEEK